MAFFDNLQRVSVGIYLPADSPVHSRDPRAKLLALIFLIISVTLTRSLAGLLFAAFFALLAALVAGLPLREAFVRLRVPLPAILLLALLQLFITPPDATGKIYFSWWIFTLTPAGLHAALVLILRFLALVWLFTAAGASISSIEMIYGFDLLFKPLQHVGIPTQSLTMTIQIMLRFIPYLVFNAEKIAKAQASRGAVWDDPRGNLFQRARHMLPLIVPLFSTSLLQADTLAQAMLARAYGASRKRTGLRDYRFDLKDGIFLLLSLIAASAILFFPPLL